MTIGMILKKGFPPDIRVEKEARSLIRAGHKVYLFCRRKKKQPIKEIINGVFVERILDNENWFLRKKGAVIFSIRFYYKKWREQLESAILENEINALHVHDLPFVKTAVIIGKKHNIPVIADLHENYPASLSCYDNPKWRRFYLYNPKRWEKYEKDILKHSTYVIAVTEEAKERIINACNVESNKIIVVPNLADISYFNSIPKDDNLIRKYKDYFVISYVGGFGLHRGIDTAIRAMKFLGEKIPQARLVIVGGKANEDKLKSLAQELNLQDKVIFTGWQLPEKLPTYISLSNICLVPHRKNPHTETAAPHKLFQYMLMKKPIIVSDCQPLKRIINETKAGLIFEAGNARDLADKIVEVYKNPGGYGENGYQAVLEKYNWEKGSKNLLNLYE